MKQYFYHDGKIQHGPFSFDELKIQNITKETKIWFEGMQEWQNAIELPELNDLFIEKAPPPITRINPPQYTSNPPKQNSPELNVNLLLVFSILGLCSAFGLGYVAIRLFEIHSAYLNGDEYLTLYCAKTFDQGLFLMGLTLFLLVFSSIILGVSVKFRK